MGSLSELFRSVGGWTESEVDEYKYKMGGTTAAVAC